MDTGIKPLPGGYFYAERKESTMQNEEKIPEELKEEIISTISKHISLSQGIIYPSLKDCILRSISVTMPSQDQVNSIVQAVLLRHYKEGKA